MAVTTCLTISTISIGWGENQRIIWHDKTWFYDLDPIWKWFPGGAWLEPPLTGMQPNVILWVGKQVMVVVTPKPGGGRPRDNLDSHSTLRCAKTTRELQRNFKLFKESYPTHRLFIPCSQHLYFHSFRGILLLRISLGVL